MTAELLSASKQYVMEQEARRQATFGSGILKAAIRQSAPRVDGSVDDWTGADWVEIDTRGAGANFNSNAKPYNIRGALAVSGDRLYAAWDTHEPQAAAELRRDSQRPVQDRRRLGPDAGHGPASRSPAANTGRR